jgi:hypothetical protein
MLMPKDHEGDVLPVADASTQMNGSRMRNDEFKETTSLLAIISGAGLSKSVLNEGKRDSQTV